MKLEDLHYVAGLLEGEGAFYTYKNNRHHTIVIDVGMTDYEPLAKIKQLCGGWLGGPYKPTVKGKDGSLRKVFWRWQLYHRLEVIELIQNLFPLMSPRRQNQITLMLNFHIQHPIKRNNDTYRPTTKQEMNEYKRIMYLAGLRK